jgi:TPR repeat protein
VAAFLLVLPISVSHVAALPRKEAGGMTEQRMVISSQISINSQVALPAAPVVGVAGKPMPLNLKAPVDGLRFVRLQKLPPGFDFNSGFRVRDTWIASIADLEKLQLTAPLSFAGTLQLEVYYHRDTQSGVVARDILVVEIKSPEPLATQSASNWQVPTGAMVVDPALGKATPSVATQIRRSITWEQEKAALAQGASLFRSGDVASARLVFEDLVNMGSARGAMALGETYDPNFLRGLVVAGLQPDADAARKWYSRAAEMGEDEAAKRLSILSPR